ncbi:MAG: hypothetical protein J6S14_17225 [Clostridia bacterium]|nr:hypothetical protein [Clostridia bacterium]
MAFQAEHILYDGISSERFGLTLFNENGGLEETGGTSFSILRSSLRGGQEFVYMGKEDADPIPMELSLISDTVLDSAMQGAIHKWLIGHSGYKELRIMQADMTTLRIGCIFHELKYLQVGNDTVGVVAIGECNSRYYRGNDIASSASGASGSFTIRNLSDINEYIYPEVRITMPSGGGNFSLVNETDNGRESVFTSLSGEEQITLYNFRQIIESSSGIRRLSAFNKKWVRILPGVNNFSFAFTGGAGRIEITMPVYKMVSQ